MLKSSFDQQNLPRSINWAKQNNTFWLSTNYCAIVSVILWPSILLLLANTVSSLPLFCRHLTRFVPLCIYPCSSYKYLGCTVYRRLQKNKHRGTLDRDTTRWFVSALRGYSDRKYLHTNERTHFTHYTMVTPHNTIWDLLNI